ncbi:hypothetical protein [Geodermatophilus ruber]|uniref:Uncharacterized protein n=1 Tax=Geodermatophilus ruber TaxID=504800 RepID=A0A1I4AMX9_9ACTN|nr:hypothetical protein [Geodermatophilus ruber]SFK57277.1 hypothetical protein SAMN04488085_102295 [Geodermatophilus ruber]
MPAQSAHPLVHRRGPRRRSPALRSPLPAERTSFAAELVRLFDEGHRCFCPECRERARAQELARRAGRRCA